MPRLALPAPVVETIAGFRIVRDDLLPGGTKSRVLPVLFDHHKEYVYAGPNEGYAQLALAICAKRYGKQATLFSAARKDKHPRTLTAIGHGAKHVGVRPGYLSVVMDRAVTYAREHGAKLLPFGLLTKELIDALANVAITIPDVPDEVWCVAGSGCLCLALQQAWPTARVCAVRIGKAVPNIGRAVLFEAPERFEQNAKEPPPYPSCGNYDSKVWKFVKQHGKPGAIVWNVAGD